MTPKTQDEKNELLQRLTKGKEDDRNRLENMIAKLGDESTQEDIVELNNALIEIIEEEKIKLPNLSVDVTKVIFIEGMWWNCSLDSRIITTKII